MTKFENPGGDIPYEPTPEEQDNTLDRPITGDPDETDFMQLYALSLTSDYYPKTDESSLYSRD
ncbi:MAG TPA: hypothetical protein VFT53_02470 [Candidatus Saccharimonadales bacterium]|nr:hypothetical protein [Candidatus Saccharimonadales bacterium]